MGLFSRSKKDLEKNVEKSAERNAKKEQKRQDKAEAKAKKASAKHTKHTVIETQGYSRIVKTQFGTSKGWCAGCHEDIGNLLDRWKMNGKVVSPQLTVPIKFHENFDELDKCCEQCLTCRVFRQAVLLKQTSAGDMERLATLKGVSAFLSFSDANTSKSRDDTLSEGQPKIRVGATDTYSTTASVLCTMLSQKAVDYLELTPFSDEVLDRTVVTSWLTECERHHFKTCGRLSWSNRNPTRLINIASATNLQLVEGASLPDSISYMALSYVWGNKSSSNTIESNKHQRMRGFAISELLKTQQDAIAFARSMKCEYVWIDAICIVQDSAEDWAQEATLMHEYYGNARFTLYVASGLPADEGFLTFRDAWKYIQLPCDIRGVNMINDDTPIDEARLMSPHARRAWTLQEECLSPRRIYWFRNGIYWACASEVHTEGITDTVLRPAQGTLASKDTQMLGRFLLTAFRREIDELLEIWLAVVESYARRHLTQPSDKFNATSGLAARCWNDGDRYLAGLWANTFAIELAWKLDQAISNARPTEPIAPGAPPRKYLDIPTWSWASLPTTGLLRFKRSLKPADDFALMEDNDDGIDSTSQDAIDEHIKQGSKVQQVRVKGRVRDFADPSAKLAPWDNVSSPLISPIDPFDFEDVSFGAYRAEHAYSVNAQTGRIAVAEPRTEEIIGQLDYIEDAALVAEGAMKVECLEVGVGAMLLVCRLDAEGTIYKRVGACHEFRQTFFNSKPCKEITLK